MNVTTTYELFSFENPQTLTKFDAVPLFNLFSHQERNQNLMTTYDSTLLSSHQATDSLQFVKKIQICALSCLLSMYTVAPP